MLADRAFLLARWKTARALDHLAYYLSLAGLFALFAGLFALTKVFANKKANVAREGTAVNCPASFGKYVPIDGRKYTGKFYSQNRSPDDGTTAVRPNRPNIRSKSEK